MYYMIINVSNKIWRMTTEILGINQSIGDDKDNYDN
jgi:hypothetical protein